MANRKSRKCPFSSPKLRFFASKPRKTSRIARNRAYMAKPATYETSSQPADRHLERPVQSVRPYKRANMLVSRETMGQTPLIGQSKR